MDKIKEAQDILESLGLPSSQQNEMSALTLLALCGITKKTLWKNASRTSMSVTKGIMDFFSLHYEKTYAPNTREGVTSHGPMTPKRVNKLIPIFKNCKSTKIYVSDFSEFKKHMSSISWDTEIWIMEHPDHMIHFNGDKFLH